MHPILLVVNIVPSVVIVALAGLVLFKGIWNRSARMFGFYLMCLGLWCLCIFILGLSITEPVALVWIRVLNIVAFVGMGFLLHSTITFLELDVRLRPVLVVSYGIALFGSVFSFTRYFISGVRRMPFGYFAEFNTGYIVFIAYFCAVFLMSNILLIVRYKSEHGIKKIQIKYIIMALIVFTGGSALLSFLPALVPALPAVPFWIYAVAAYAAIIAYAIVRHRLMDIDVIIKATSVYVILFAFVTSIYMLTIFLFEHVIARAFGLRNDILTRIVAGMLVAFFFIPVRDITERIIENLFFGRKYNYIKLLRDFSRDLADILDLRYLLETIAMQLQRILNVHHVVIYLHNKENNRFEPKAFIGVDNDIRNTGLANDDPLIVWFKQNDNLLYSQSSSAERGLIMKMRERYGMSEAALFLPFFFNRALVGFLTLSEKRGSYMYTDNDLQLLHTIANEISIAISNAISYDELKKTYFGTMEAFASAIESKDKYTWGHSDRVMNIARHIAVAMGLSREEIDTLQYAAVLHDIGKIAIENSILNKKGKLEVDEFEVVKQHPKIGESIIFPVAFLRNALPAIRHHHEWWNGNGYPDGLKESEIPLLARILCVADAFDAITSSRPYREKQPIQFAIEEIKRSSETQFDPAVVKTFLYLIDLKMIE